MNRQLIYQHAVEKELAKTYSDNFTDELMDRFCDNVISVWHYELNPEHAALELLKLYDMSK